MGRYRRARTGSRPSAVRQTEYEWVYLWAPVGPATGAYSPELNPAERLWAWLRGRQLSNRISADYDELPRETDRAWLTLDPETIKSVCRCPWIERALQA